MIKRASYTSGEVSKILDLSDRTVRSYLRNGRIPAKQNPHTGRWKVSREGLLAFMKQYQMTHNEEAVRHGGECFGMGAGLLAQRRYRSAILFPARSAG